MPALGDTLGLSTLDLIIVAAYLCVTVVVGLFLARLASGAIEDYFLGGRRIPWWVMGASGTASNFDMTGTMVIVSFFFAMGLQGFWVEMRGGVGLNLAILLVFMGKWLRRSKVMTTAEWMEYRFGTGPGGQAARLLSAISNLVVVVGMIIYFAKGTGKFFAIFLPFSPDVCSLIVMAVALSYTALSGLYGVAYTDVFQEVVLIVVAVVITVKAFFLPEQAQVLAAAGEAWQSVGYPTEGQVLEGVNVEGWLGGHAWMIQALGIVVFFAIVRNLLEGFGGYSGGYGPQRFYAARDERSASLMTAEWVGLLSIRWALIASLAILGLWIAQTDAVLGAELFEDPERTLPVVLGSVLPAGLRGLAVAGLVAAAMSTFDSTVNAGAAYWVRDIYQRYLHPEATQRQLVRQSWISSVAIAASAVLLAMAIHNINEIWTWITGPLSAGLFGPLILRWYWGRFNGWGFAISTGAGLVMSILLKLQWPDMHLEWTFSLTLVVSVAAGVVGSLRTAPVPPQIADKFFSEMRPFGLWAAERRRAGEGVARSAMREGLRDLGNLPFAIGWQLCLFLGVVYLVMHSWQRSLAFFLASSLCAIVLYFSWFKKLPPYESD